MNAPRMHQERRERQINQIIASVEKQMLKTEIVFNDVVLATMANLNLSRRTARDYVSVVFFKLGL